MPTRVFSQQPDLVAALPRLLQHARRFFAAELEVLSASATERPDPSVAELQLLLQATRYPGRGAFRIESRRASEQDWQAADAAEARGKAGGMAALARRCALIWSITPEQADSGCAELQLCALLASVALGPVLPADASTLYGVRGAMERAERAAAQS